MKMAEVADEEGDWTDAPVAHVLYYTICMEFIDPSLQSSVERASVDEKQAKSLFWKILVAVAIVFVVWLIYAFYSSKLDTRPTNSIDVNPDLLEPKQNGKRTAPISDTL